MNILKRFNMKKKCNKCGIPWNGKPNQYGHKMCCGCPNCGFPWTMFPKGLKEYLKSLKYEKNYLL